MMPADHSKGWSLSRISKCLYVASATLIISLAVTALVMNHFGYKPLPLGANLIKLGFIIALLLPVAVLVLDILPNQIVPNIHLIWQFRAEADVMFRQEIEHDTSHIHKLVQVDRELLLLADKWLALKVERIDHRNGQLVEGPGKLALISLVTTGWSALQELSKITNQALYNGILYAVAFLAGLTLAALLLNTVKQRHIYHRQLISLALHEQRR